MSKAVRTSVQKRINERKRWLEAGDKSEHAKLTSHQMSAVIRLLEEGATLVEIARYDGMPSVGAVYSQQYADPAFDEAVRAARASAATTALEEAQHELREALESGDPDRMRVASAYHAGTVEYAAKIAPKEYGQLVKLAGADGGALSIQVVSYAIEQADKSANAVLGGQLESIEASRESDV